MIELVDKDITIGKTIFHIKESKGKIKHIKWKHEIYKRLK